MDFAENFRKFNETMNVISGSSNGSELTELKIKNLEETCSHVLKSNLSEDIKKTISTDISDRIKLTNKDIKQQESFVDQNKQSKNIEVENVRAL